MSSRVVATEMREKGCISLCFVTKENGKYVLDCRMTNALFALARPMSKHASIKIGVRSTSASRVCPVTKPANWDFWFVGELHSRRSDYSFHPGIATDGVVRAFLNYATYPGRVGRMAVPRSEERVREGPAL